MTIEQFLTQLSEHCGLAAEDLKIEVDLEDDEFVTVTLQIPEDESGRFIGFHGETLESLQRICRVIFQEEYPDKKLVVNINQYRQDREERLQEITESVVEKVLQTGKPYTFTSFMPAHERFIIHTAVTELDPNEELESVSEGTGRNRRLTIQPKG